MNETVKKNSFKTIFVIHFKIFLIFHNKVKSNKTYTVQDNIFCCLQEKKE